MGNPSASLGIYRIQLRLPHSTSGSKYALMAYFDPPSPREKVWRPAAAVAPKGRQIHTTNSAINENLKRWVSLKGEQVCIMYLYEITIFAKKYIFIDLVVEFLRLLC